MYEEVLLFSKAIVGDPASHARALWVEYTRYAQPAQHDGGKTDQDDLI